MKTEFEKLNEQASKNKVQEFSLMEQFNNRFLLENKLRDYEVENRTLREEKQRFEVDYKVLLERFTELKKVADERDSELNYLKIKQADEVANIETKLDKMSKEMDILQRDNNTLRVNEARLRQEILNLEKQRDTYQEKYQDHKTKNNLLNSKLTEVRF
jgi:chromosome segregation ATPase